MVWVIAIATATFIATLVAVRLMLFIFSQIREAVREQRIERRIPAQGDLELSSLDEPLIYDKALIENASRHGARVVAKKHWRPNDHLLVTLPQCSRSSRARIAYCNPLPGDAFAIGLQFPSTLDVSNVERLSHPYRK